MTRNSDRRDESLIRSATVGAAFAAMLVIGVPASAGEGGDPAHRISIFEQVKESKATPAPEATKVVEASAPSTPTKRWHDKTEAEWRAYHAAMREFQRRNTGR